MVLIFTLCKKFIHNCVYISYNHISNTYFLIANLHLLPILASSNNKKHRTNGFHYSNNYVIIPTRTV